MQTNRHTEAPAVPPHARLIQMATGYWVSRMLYAAAAFGLADRIAGSPKSAAELAGPTRTHAGSLHRLLRGLAAVGVLSEVDGGRFALTALGEALQAGAPGSARASVLALAGDFWWRGWSQFLYCVETGRTATEKEFGLTIFEYLAQHPEEASYFNEAMVGFHGDEPAAIAAAYDFSECQTVVDIGGGTGNLLTTILRCYPGSRGVLVDLPHVVDEARTLIGSTDLAARIAFADVDFFESVPAGGDVYLLSHVIHDWSEEQCVTILSNCRTAMKPGARLLIVEMVLPSGDAPHPGKLLDLAMLVMPGGRERTEDEYRMLLQEAGLRLARVVSTGSAVSIVEAM